MPKFKALVFKTEYSSDWIEIEAESEEDAWEKLNDDIDELAKDYSFISISDAEYEVGLVEEIEEKD